jgi:hypothetical protein
MVAEINKRKTRSPPRHLVAVVLIRWMNCALGPRDRLLEPTPPNGGLELILNRHLGSIEAGDRETDIFVIAPDVIL